MFTHYINIVSALQKNTGLIKELSKTQK